jgi:alpha-beta hydrolase superfamily lysophospholipase
MGLREIEFQSYNERDTVKAWVYTPIRKPTAIVQVVHGLFEHSRRYLHLILALNEAGFIVAADDHVGHGKTAADSNTWGDYGDKGFMTTIEDEKKLHDIVAKDFPGLPYFLFGHSWGSMITRGFAACYGETLSGIAICGTCGTMDSMQDVGIELKAAIDAGKGGERNAEYLGRMFAGWTDRYEDPADPNGWVSADPDIVADVFSDSLHNHHVLPTNQANYDSIALVDFITGRKWAEKIPKTLPVYSIAGDLDPVGNYGEGVYAVTNWLAETGHRKLTTTLYSGRRHEIHQDRDIRDKVEAGIIAFITSLLGC